MPLPDDHDDKWEYQQHTRAKHEVLHYYLDVWTRIVSDPRYPLRIYDCFAGRGDYADSDGADPIPLRNIDTDVDYPGSPLIMLDAVCEHQELFRNAELYFLEPNDTNRDELQSNLATVEGLPDNVNTNVVDEEFADGIRRVISSSGGWGDFGFFFMDPFGLKALDYHEVSRITSTSRFDCLITLMTKELIRWQSSSGHNETFETLYGTSSWREDLENYQPEQLETAEAEYYCDRLESGGTDYTLAYMTTRGDSRELMYDLVFTTNDPKGLDAMRESMMRCGSNYALAYAPERSDIGGPEQAKLTGGQMLTEENRAKSYLMTRFAGEELSFDDMVLKVFEDPGRRYADSLRHDYRNYMKDLHDDGEVEIPERQPGSNTLSEDYTIIFPETDQE